jgi:hypothetical protein
MKSGGENIRNKKSGKHLGENLRDKKSKGNI